MSWRLLRLAPILLAPACAVDLTEPWEVIEPRLMGARIEVEGAPERPRPRLGERFAVRQFIALPGPLATPLDQRYSMDVALCLGFKTPAGDLACIGQQELTPNIQVVSETEVLLSGIGIDLGMLAGEGLMLPPGVTSASDLTAPDALDRLALFGVLCVEGKAERVPGRDVRHDPPSQLFRCVDNQGARFPAPSSFTLSVLLDRGLPTDPNRNPAFACDPAAPDSPCSAGIAAPGEARVPGSIVLVRPRRGEQPRQVEAWSSYPAGSTPSWEGCASDPNLPQVRSDSGEHTVRVRFDPSDREGYLYEVELNNDPNRKVVREGREALLLSHAISTKGGELERHFSQLNADEPDAEGEISFDYTPPEQSDKLEERIPDNGRLVRFYFTLRDERGGIDFTTRELCLVPGDSEE